MQSTKQVMPVEKDTNSAEFKEGLEAGLNSSEDTTNWQAGNELGQELKDGGEPKAPASEGFVKEQSIPLFMRNTPSSHKGNPLDEKDEAEE